MYVKSASQFIMGQLNATGNLSLEHAILLSNDTSTKDQGLHIKFLVI